MVRDVRVRATLPAENVFRLEHTRATSLGFDEPTRAAFGRDLRAALDGTPEVGLDQQTNLMMARVLPVSPAARSRSASAPSSHTLTAPTPAVRQVPSASRIRAVRSSTSARVTPAGVSWRVRCSLSSDHVSARGTTASCGTSPRPSVKAPPRGSTAGSHSTMAPAPEPARTAPSCQAATSASHSGLCISTERRCMGEPSAM